MTKPPREAVKVAVLLSSYNGERYIKEQLIGIIGQKTAAEVTVFVRDDGSTDGTAGILKCFEAEYPETVRVYYGENIGYKRSFFELLRMTEGFNYYALSDQDDIWLDDKIETAISACEKRARNKSGGDADKRDGEVPLLYGSSSFIADGELNVIGETQKNLRGFSWRNILIQNIIPGHSQVFNEPLRRILCSDIDCDRICVHDFWITYMAYLYGEIIFDNTSHTLYRQHGGAAFGFGKNIFGWVKLHLRRTGAGYNRQISAQIAYFYEKCSEDMDDELKGLITSFLDSQDSFMKRLKFLMNAHMYRQRKFETLLFDALYLIGEYKPL